MDSWRWPLQSRTLNVDDVDLLQEVEQSENRAAHVIGTNMLTFLPPLLALLALLAGAGAQMTTLEGPDAVRRKLLYSPTVLYSSGTPNRARRRGSSSPSARGLAPTTRVGGGAPPPPPPPSQAP